jgi:hypothetical protein
LSSQFQSLVIIVIVICGEMVLLEPDRLPPTPSLALIKMNKEIVLLS